LSSELSQGLHALELPTASLPKLVVMFAVYLFDTRHLQVSTINQYVSHVGKYLFDSGVIPSTEFIRTPLLKAVLSGLGLEQSRVKLPKSFSCYLPFTLDMLLMVDRHFLSKMPRHRRVTFLAAFSLAYGLSLRTNEFLPALNVPFDPAKHVAVDNMVVWFCNHQGYFLDDPKSWPRLGAVAPSHISVQIPHRKNLQDGTGGSLLLSANPDRSQFCLVRAVLEFCVLMRPARGRPLLQASRFFTLDWAAFREVLRQYAATLGVPMSRLVPYSGRYGVLMNMNAMGYSSDFKLAQGNWKSEGGCAAYWRQSFAFAKAVAPAVYNVNAGLAEEVVAVYCPPAQAVEAARVLARLRAPAVV
jgi:hypothetical protein